MRLRLRHTLHIGFPEPARNVMAVLRLSPRSHEGQRITNWRIDVDPDCLLKSGEDHFGNLVHTLTVPGVVSELNIAAQGELTSFDALGIVRGTAERLPVDVYLRDTALTVPGESVRDLARRCAGVSDSALGRMHALMGEIHAAMSFAPAVRGFVQVEAALQSGQGGPRDHAQVFVAAARHLGVPARCATGFFLDADGGSRRHAWAEAYVGDLGWVGFDAVHNICPQDHHVRGAVGLDAFEASGLRGAFGLEPEESVAVTWLFGREGRPDRERPA